MAEYKENPIFKELATRYVEHYGEQLLEEAAQLNEQPSVTPRMDSNIRQHVQSGKRLRYATGITAFAAAIALAVMLPSLINLNNSDIVSEAPSAASSSPTSSAEVPPAQAESTAPSQDAEAAPAPELIPISFTLPDHLTVTDAKLDNGKSVYHLSNNLLDDIVMTMERDPGEDVFAELRTMRINDSTVYYKYAADHSVMAFENQGVTYVLTCKYDVNTLVPLAEAIL